MRRFCSILLFALISAHSQAGTNDLLSLVDRLRVEITDTRSTLIRATARIETRITIKVSNAGDRPILPPLHMVMRLTGDTAGAAVSDALGGIDLGPYLAHYFDLSGFAGGAGLAPGSFFTRDIVYSRPAGTSLGYSFEGLGKFNRNPVAVMEFPSIAIAGQSIMARATNSYDPDGDDVSFFWSFGDDTSGTTADAEVSYDAPGVYNVRLLLLDARGASSVTVRAVQVVPSDAFALAQVRTLDDAGQPLGGVRVDRLTTAGDVTFFTDAASGFLAVEGDPGEELWKFTSPDHLPVWRKVALVSRDVTLVPSPWLAETPARSVPVTPLNPVVIGDAGDPAVLSFGPGSFTMPGELAFTPLDGQTLPFPLPRGWSPLRAFHFQPPGELAAAVAVQWQLPAGPVPPDCALLTWNDDEMAWQFLSAIPGPSATSTVMSSGWYVLAMADHASLLAGLSHGDGVPFAAASDDELPAAAGQLDPARAAASLEPDEMTTLARVSFVTTNAMTSGRFFRTKIAEQYQLVDGTTIQSPEYDTTFYAYRGGGAAISNQLQAEFRLRPSQVIPPGDVHEASIIVSVLDSADFNGTILNSAGGFIQTDSVQVRIPSGAYSNLLVAEMAELDPAGFSGLAGRHHVVSAFTLHAPEAFADFSVTVQRLLPGAHYVLARLVTVQGAQKLEPLLRMEADASGIARTVEPENGPALPGLRGGGRYAVVQVSARQGLVTGTIRALDGSARRGLAGSIAGEPWASTTSDNGAYFLVAAPGTGVVQALDPVDLNAATGEFSLATSSDVATVDLRVVSTGPRVSRVHPADGAVQVSEVTSVQVFFSEPVVESSFGPAGLALVDATGGVVQATASLNLPRTAATLIPVDPLDFFTQYTIVVSDQLADALTNKISGTLEFSFRTRSSPSRGLGAQLTIYEPGATNIPADVLDKLIAYTPGVDPSSIVVHGSQGSADPEVPVILVNESSGETSTVLSKPDGSFYGVITGTEEDFVSATFVNGNGTRITIPVSRQEFDNGFVGLYNQGGILEAESDGSGPKVFIEPESIPSRSKFKVDTVELGLLLQLLSNSMPTAGTILSAATVSHETSEDLTKPGKISMPVNLSGVALPPGITDPADADYVLTSVMETETGDYVYEIIDTMRLEGDRLVTESPPYAGILFKRLSELYKNSSFKKLKAANKLFEALDLPNIQQTAVHALLLPFMMLQGNSSDVVGTVYAVRVNANGDPINEPFPVPGAVVTFERPPFLSAGRLRPGELVCSANERGKYAFRVDVDLEGTGFQLAATHPRFPNERALTLGRIGKLAERLLSGGLYQNSVMDVQVRDVFFTLYPQEASEDLLPPEINAGHAPSLPFTGATNGAMLVVNASDDIKIESLAVNFVEARNYNGSLVTNANVVIVPGAPVKTATKIEQTFTIRSDRSARIRLEIKATDAEGKLTDQNYLIDFGRPPIVSTPTEPGTPAPLRVVMAWPPNGSAGHAPFPELTLRFSKSLPVEAFTNTTPDWIVVNPPHRLVAVMPSDDFREAKLRVEGESGGTLALTVGSPLEDRAGAPFDQNPATTNTFEQYSYQIGLVAPSVTPMNIIRGGGVRGQGVYYYALDRRNPGSISSQLVVYDVRNPSNIVEVSRVNLLANASDLVFLPDYVMPDSFASGSGLTVGPCVKRDLLVVVGGSVGVTDVSPKWIRLFDVSNPASPTVISGGVISFNTISLISKVQLAAPALAYLETAADSTSINVMNLVSFALGHSASKEQAAMFPEIETDGVDFDHDGSYCGPGEKAPLPAQNPPNYYGFLTSFAPLDSRERIVDFHMSEGGQTIVGVLKRLTNSTHLFRVYLGKGGIMDDDEGNLEIPAPYEPKRVKYLHAQSITVSNQLRILDLALITLFEPGEKHALMIVDMSDPARPVELKTIVFPPGSGVPNSIEMRSDGTLSLAFSQGGDILLLDPKLLLSFDAAGNWLAPLNRVSGFGTGIRSYVSDVSGLQLSTAGAEMKIGFTGPQIRWVTFAEAPFDAGAMPMRTDLQNRRTLASARPVDLARTMAKSVSTSPSGGVTVNSTPGNSDHYYILVNAPGGQMINNKIDLMVASISAAGGIPAPRSLSAMPDVLFDDVTRGSYTGAVASTNGFAFPGSIKAHRLSNNPASDLYNTYVAGPVTLHNALSANVASALQTQLPRFYLRATRNVVAALSPHVGMEHKALAPYASQSTNQQLSAGTSRILPVLSSHRPLVFVPGVMASRLVDKNSIVVGSGIVSDLWINPANSLNFMRGDLADLVLNPDGTDASGANIRAVDALRNLIADTSIIDTDIQGRFINFFTRELGYTEYLAPVNTTLPFGAGVVSRFNSNPGRFRLDEEPDWNRLGLHPDLYVFGYDWRQSVSKNADSLKLYIDLILAANPDFDSVDIIAHSMGGLVSRRMIMDHPDAVSRLITICSPFLGAPKAIFSMLTGDIDDEDLNLIVPDDISRDIARYMPAMHQLLPNKGYFELFGRPMIERGFDANNDNTLNSEFDYNGYKAALDGPLLEEDGEPHPSPISTNNEPMAVYGNSSTDNQYNWSQDSSGVEFYNIVALQSDPRTITGVELQQDVVAATNVKNVAIALPPLEFFDSEQIGGDFPLLPGTNQLNPFDAMAYKSERRYQPVRGAGDGTVPFFSQTRGYSRNNMRLNPAGTVVLPVLPRDNSADQVKLSSHVGVLKNPDLHKLVARILRDGISESDQPMLSVSAPASANEGEVINASVSISRIPTDAQTITPVVLWDMGDGQVLPGASVSYSYRRPGSYIMSCSVSYPGVIGAVESRTIVISNVAPTVALSISPSNAVPVAGSAVMVVADVTDPGLTGNYSFTWTVDGELQSNMPPNAHFLERSYNEARDYTIDVGISENGGVTNTASLTLSINQQPVPTQRSLPRPEPSSISPAAPAVETASAPNVTVVVRGHRSESRSDITVMHDGNVAGKSLPGSDIIYDSMGVSIGKLAGKEQSVFFASKNTGGGTPAESTVKVIASETIVSFSLTYDRGSQLACYTFETTADIGDEITLKIPWSLLPGVTAAQLDAMLVTEGFHSSARVTCHDKTPPVVHNQWDEKTQEIDLTVLDYDRSALDQTTVDQEPVFTKGSAIGFVEEQDSCTLTDGKFIVKVRTPKVHSAAIPTTADGVVTPDRDGVVKEQGTVKPASHNSELTEQDAQEIRDAVHKAFRQGATTELFEKFVLELDDLLILEQGTGANLWKAGGLGKLRGAYTKGVSDNDYEIYMPVIKSTANMLDANQPAHRSNMVIFAHTPSYMTGDWYFKPPEGITASGHAMGPVPPVHEIEAYTNYLATVAKWRYVIPFGFSPITGPTGNQDGEDYVEFDKGQKFFQFTQDGVTRFEGRSIFDNPATPAEVISFALTMRLRQDEPLRKILKDVSFFPFRREHFEFAVMSLEKPPPFGDDPLGDAGMGRGLLLLKWLLEGAVLQEFSSGLADENAFFNRGVTAQKDVEIRSEIFNRLKQRMESVAVDGYEWGIYQEFASLNENVPLRVKNAVSGSECLQAFDDYLKKHDGKSIKKLGKSAIRGAMARLAAERSSRPDLFAVDPAEFDNDASLKSYEHLVARLANDNISLFDGYTTNDINDFMNAKLAEKNLIKKLTFSASKVDEFATHVFKFLQENVQNPTAVVFGDELERMQIEGRMSERHIRVQNVKAIDYGMRIPGGVEKNGRDKLHGAVAGHEFEYALVPTLRRVGQASPGPYTVTLDGGGRNVVVNDINFAGTNTLVVVDQKDADGNPLLAIFGSPGTRDTTAYTLSMNLTPDVSTPDNVSIYMESYVLPTTFNHVDEFAVGDDRLMLYRGFAVNAAGYTSITNQLAHFAIQSLARLRGISDSVAVASNVASLVTWLGSHADFFEFRPSDIFHMTDEQKAALRHIKDVPTNSPGISTSFDLDTAAIFALQTDDPAEKSYVVALEVPIRHGGYHLLPTDVVAPSGQRVTRAINPPENEVVFLHEAPFMRAHLYEVKKWEDIFGVDYFTLHFVDDYERPQP